jgi:hypothetical protein
MARLGRSEGSPRTSALPLTADIRGAVYFSVDYVGFAVAGWKPLLQAFGYQSEVVLACRERHLS